jgi:hypothetical protein
MNDMIKLVEQYIWDRKGVQVRIFIDVRRPDEIIKLKYAFHIAKKFYDQQTN